MNSRVALLLVLCINLFLFMAQLAVTDIAADLGTSGSSFYDYESNIFSDYDLGNYTVKDTYSDEFPITSSTVSADEGNWFTDTFTTIKEWFLDSTGLSYGLAFINAVPNLLKVLIPVPAVAFAMGALWHIFTVFLLIMSFRGGD